MPSPNNPMGRQILGGAITPVYIAGSEADLSVTGGLTDAELRAADVAVTLDGEAVTVGGVDVPTGSPLVGQSVIAVTGTRVALSAVSVPLPTSSVLVYALSGNSAAMTVGGAAVTNTITGAGNGYILEAGQSTVIMTDDLSSVYVNGTAGDIATYSAG